MDHFKTVKQAELIEYYSSYLKVDGIIVFNLKTTIKKGYDIPIVSLFGSSNGLFDSVKLDFSDAMTQAFDLLYELGHRKIAYIGVKIYHKNEMQEPIIYLEHRDKFVDNIKEEIKSQPKRKSNKKKK